MLSWLACSNNLKNLISLVQPVLNVGPKQLNNLNFNRSQPHARWMWDLLNLAALSAISVLSEIVATMWHSQRKR